MQLISFNPCFNGTYSLTHIGDFFEMLGGCFNPCFNGTYSLTWALFVVQRKS